MTGLTPSRKAPRIAALVLRRLLSTAALWAALCASQACLREESGQTALLLRLSTLSPVDCIALSQKSGVNPAGLAQQLVAPTLPAGFSNADKATFRKAQTTALVYAGGPLGQGDVILAAEGHRGGCQGPVVAHFGPVTARFEQGRVVEVPAVLALNGVDEDGDGYSPPEDCDDHDPTVHPGAAELCDGRDHSCSGVLDKGCGCAGPARSCYPLGLGSPTLTHGICRAGSQACEQGKWSGSCVGAVTPEPERCDGLDHDCDGQAGTPTCPCAPGAQRRCFTKGPAALAGVGRCSYGQQTCSADGFFGPCVGDVGPLPVELCNGIDDNCDGRVDEMVDAQGREVMPRPACDNQAGVCADSRKSCRAGAFQACGAAEYQESAALHHTFYGADGSTSCDGVDHDCDGVIGGPACQACSAIGAARDCYGPGLGSPTLGRGVCRKGTQTCIRSGAGALVWSRCANEIDPTPEVCDGKDNDCNGAIDDLALGEGQACGTGLAGVCADGAQACKRGLMTCTPLTAKSPETCDGLDNDCNGLIDELWDKLHDPQHCGGAFDCRACAAGNACCGGRCADLQGDPNDCGACGNACGASQGCCAGACVALDGGANCGACGKVCTGGLTCRGGRCAPAHEISCSNGLDDDQNGLTDCQDPDCQGRVCDQTGGTCNGGTCQHETNCRDGKDNDGDGLVDCADPDCRGKSCDGHGGLCTPDGRCVAELCHNGIDDNGDGKIDCQDAAACPPPGSFAKPVCCGIAWVDAASDVRHCGGCGTDCTAGHDAVCGSIACQSGRCVYGSAPDRSACPGGVCCKGGCVPDRETSCSNGVDDNCDGRTDCQDAASCPPPGGETRPACCSLSWTDLDHGDPGNCGACGRVCPPSIIPGSCAAPVCNPGGQCGLATDCGQPGCDGASCTEPGGGAGKCAGGVCCAGCVSADGVCGPGADLHACKSGTGACEDCQPSQNACITDTCTAAGCRHTFNTGPCTGANGAAGFCNQGVCCGAQSCLDANGACQPISATSCGKPGGACLAQSCDDGNACTQDSCDTSGSAARCVHSPDQNGASCTDGSANGTCEGGACCLGCVANGACVPPASESGGQCGAAGAACGVCPAATSDCQRAACSLAGACTVSNLPDGQACTASAGAGVCSGGACLACTGSNQCGAACCTPGTACQGNGTCACDAKACGKLGNVCAQNQCVPPGPSSCAANGKKYCPANNNCVAACDLFACGLALFTCGGPTCLASNNPDTSNVCSDGVHPESCDLVSYPTARCSCDGTLKPGTCANGPKSVCAATGQDFHCFTCGDAGTDGLPCKGSGTCNQAQATCN